MYESWANNQKHGNINVEQLSYKFTKLKIIFHKIAI
jgi:hypothetical protein